MFKQLRIFVSFRYSFRHHFLQLMPFSQKTTTMDDNGKLHSFNDMPASVEHGSQSWYRHGEQHRDNGLPSTVVAEPKLLAIFRKPFHLRWRVLGVPHNITGPSYVSASNTRWNLYGLEINETEFALVINEAAYLNVPVWVALIKNSQIIDEEVIDSLRDKNGNWSTDLPIEWLFRLWGITDNETLLNAQLPSPTNYRMYSETSVLLENMLTVIKYEESQRKPLNG